MTIDTPTSAVRRRWQRLGRHGLATVLMSLAVLAVFGTVAYAAILPGSNGPARELKTSGVVKIKDSRGKASIVGMQRMLPGNSVTGMVNIGNASKKVRANFTVGISRLVEIKGTGGGLISNRLVLVVKRLSSSRRPQTLYAGPLRQMPLIKLGIMRAGETRTYQFTVAFPASYPALDNRFQGGAVNLQFTWYARQVK